MNSQFRHVYKLPCIKSSRSSCCGCGGSGCGCPPPCQPPGCCKPIRGFNPCEAMRKRIPCSQDPCPDVGKVTYEVKKGCTAFTSPYACAPCPPKGPFDPCKPPQGGPYNYKMYQGIFMYIMVPLIFLQWLKCSSIELERPMCVDYEHMRRITKRWPWGDGKTSLFHNPHMNVLPGECHDEPEKTICDCCSKKED